MTDLQLVKTGARFFWFKSRVQAQSLVVGVSADGCARVKVCKDAIKINGTMHAI